MFILNSDFPDNFIPLYTMVSFTSIPYATALERGEIQDKILNELLNIESDSIENYNKEKAQELISKHLPKINSK